MVLDKTRYLGLLEVSVVTSRLDAVPTVILDGSDQIGTLVVLFQVRILPLTLGSAKNVVLFADV